MNTDKKQVELRLEELSRILESEANETVRTHISMMCRALKLYHYHVSQCIELNSTCQQSNI